MTKILKISIFLISNLICSLQINAQSMLDVSVGTSHQDNFFTNVAFRKQVSEKFRIGLEAQYGAAKYRLIEAKPITEGYSTTIGVPLTLRMKEKDQIRLDFYAKPGLRFQGVIDPDKNDIRDSLLTSTAISFDAGLLLTVKVSETLNFQSGVTFPLFYQIRPSAIFENIYPGLLHFGGNYKIGEKSTFFAKTAFGAALGGGGDTQKFGWSLQGGVRFSFGKEVTPSFVEPSF
jgi:hypothetical protein